MIVSTFVLLAAAMSVAGASGLAFESGRRRGAFAARRPLEARLAEVERVRDAADQQGKQLRAELAWLQELRVSSHVLSARPVFQNRLAPRDAEELSKLVRGLSLVDDVVLADAQGWPQSRETDRNSADLCALVPALLHLTTRLAERGLHVLALDLETSAAQHVHARPLQGRGEGSTLLVKTTSQPVSRSVPDAVAHAASRGGTDVRAPKAAVFLPITERADAGKASPALAAVLERELASSALAVAVTVEGRIVYSASNEGPDAAARACAARELDAFAAASGHTLRSAVTRLQLHVAGAHTLSWAAFGSGSTDSLVVFGRADERAGARLDRLLGSVRRSLGAPAALAFESEGAA